MEGDHCNSPEEQQSKDCGSLASAENKITVQPLVFDCHRSSFTQWKLWYSPSNGKLTTYDKKAYDSGRFKCGLEQPFFEDLQVIEGQLYGLMYDRAKLRQNNRMIRLDSLPRRSPDVTAAASTLDHNCHSSLIVSPQQFIGMCPHPKNPFLYRPTSVTGTTIVQGPNPYREKFEADGDVGINAAPWVETHIIDRFIWRFDILATEIRSRAFYSILFDFKEQSNNTIYRMDHPQFKTPLLAVLKLDQPPLLKIPSSKDEIQISQLLVVP